MLALAIPESDRYGWLQLLRDLSIEPSGGHRVHGHLDVLEAGTALVSQEFGGIGRSAYKGREEIALAPG